MIQAYCNDVIRAEVFEGVSMIVEINVYENTKTA
jgi:hypothetical protein